MFQNVVHDRQQAFLLRRGRSTLVVM